MLHVARAFGMLDLRVAGALTHCEASPVVHLERRSFKKFQRYCASQAAYLRDAIAEADTARHDPNAITPRRVASHPCRSFDQRPTLALECILRERIRKSVDVRGPGGVAWWIPWRHRAWWEAFVRRDVAEFFEVALDEGKRKPARYSPRLELLRKFCWDC